ncbi:MAG: hypothetical protein IJX77_10195 [Ruminococcus sp.]|nr:hypothetical protein [Ruminococcus sp.]
MSPYEKAEAILNAINLISETITPEDILRKCTPQELDFYYNKLCKEDHK